jgi:hypothetical protein
MRYRGPHAPGQEDWEALPEGSEAVWQSEPPATLLDPFDDGGATMSERTDRPAERPALAPEPEWVRGICPRCGAPVVSNLYHVGGKGYILRWECWQAIGPEEARICDWRRVL